MLAYCNDLHANGIYSCSGSLYIKANHSNSDIDRSSSFCALDRASGNAREQSETWGTPSTRERN